MDLIAEPTRARELARGLAEWPSLTLDERQLQVLELLIDGSLAPLDRYMTRAEVAMSGDRLRLPDGTFWPFPIVLDAADAATDAIAPGMVVALRDPEGTPLAVLQVADRWQPDAETFAQATTDRIANTPPRAVRLAGQVVGLRFRRHADFADLRLHPHESVRELADRGWRGALAYYTDRFPQRRPFEAAYDAAERAGSGLVVLAALPNAEPIDHRHYARVRAWRAALEAFPANRTRLIVLPGALPDGPRGGALSAIVARNHGCTQIVVGRDVHGVLEGVDHLGIEPVLETACDDVVPDSRIQHMLESRAELPAELTFPVVADELRRQFPPRGTRGLTVFFTGLSGSGKSTIANALRARLLDRGGRRVTLLDGDLVRRHLSSELGFSRDHRDLNIRRIGFVAAEITRHGGIAICAPIAPYDATRRHVRDAVEAVGDFVLVYVDTPLAECMSRDPKGLYARARAGLIPEFTGISDPYEVPANAEIVLRTTEITAEQAAEAVVQHLEREGYLVDHDSR